jgi:MFS family permease
VSATREGNAGSALGPLRHRAFALLWSAALVANVGTWFRDVANGWSMTQLAPSPLMVALVQAAATLPVFLLSLPAGALADLVDRRRLLLVIQLLLVATSLALAIAQTSGWMTAPLLLALAFCGGIGAALMGPPWQSIVPELVPRTELRPAIALNSLGINIARALGPALGGLVVATAGAATAYWIDAASYVPVIAALLLLRSTGRASARLPERFAPALVSGVRFVVHSREVRRVLARAFMFFVFASAYWALLPLLARQSLGGGAGLYGVLLTSIGAGAVCGAFALPAIARHVSGDVVVLGATLATAAATAVCAWAPSPATVAAGLFVAGGAWIAALTTLNVAAQVILPAWVRARGLAVYITTFFGAMTLGSLLWGALALHGGVPVALYVAAAGGVIGSRLVARVTLPSGDADLTPSRHWPEPAVADEVAGERGPVLVSIEYRVPPERRREFLESLDLLSSERLKDGGVGWQVYADAEDPGRYVEVFHAASWRDHLRTHERTTIEAARLQAEVQRFHVGPTPHVTHWIAARPDDDASPAPMTAGTPGAP